MHKYWNLPLHEQLSFNSLVEKKYFHGNMGTNKIGGAPQNNTLRFFSWGEIPQNTHRNKKGVVYVL